MSLDLDALKSPEYVEQPVSLETALTTEVGRGFAEDLLDLARLLDEFRVSSHQHGCGATDMRCGHARTIEIAPAVAGRRMNTLARGDQVRLQPAVTGGTAAGKKLTP